MTYKCEKCGATSEKEGMCPTCNLPMVAVAEQAAVEEVAAPAVEATPEAPSEPQA